MTFKLKFEILGLVITYRQWGGMFWLFSGVVGKRM
jgi:hypothetical protein